VEDGEARIESEDGRLYLVLPSVIEQVSLLPSNPNPRQLIIFQAHKCSEPRRSREISKQQTVKHSI
jgi:hypothetical protein